MKSTSTLLFASAAAALEYGAAPASSSKHAYTTIVPGGEYATVTVTSQYQTVPTYLASKSSLSSYVYVSTVITDYDGNKRTITKTEDPVTVYHSKYTKTHTTTISEGYHPYGKNATATPAPKTKVWEELYEKIDWVPYKDLGPYALPGYPGSGLCEECYGSASEGHDDTKYQPVSVKEYKNGKWDTYEATYTYGAPTPKVTTYETPGVYTVPSYDLTVHETTTAAVEAKYTASPGEIVTYGGASTKITKPTTVTAAYAVCETHGAETKTVIKTTTIHADKPGTYTIVKPTTTSYADQTVYSFPTIGIYLPGVYHHDRETITVTKTEQAYTRSYDSTSTYPSSSSKDDYPTASSTGPSYPDPSSDYTEPEESYGVPYAGYVKRGGMLERRTAEQKKAPLNKRQILV